MFLGDIGFLNPQDERDSKMVCGHYDHTHVGSGCLQKHFANKKFISPLNTRFRKKQGRIGTSELGSSIYTVYINLLGSIVINF